MPGLKLDEKGNSKGEERNGDKWRLSADALNDPRSRNGYAKNGKSLCSSRTHIMFYGLVVASAYIKTYCEQYMLKDYIIPDIMAYDHPKKQRNGAFVKKWRILEVNTA